MLDRIEDRIGIEQAPGETPREYLEHACDRLDCEADDREALVAAYEAGRPTRDRPSCSVPQKPSSLRDRLVDGTAVMNWFTPTPSEGHLFTSDRVWLFSSRRRR